MTRNRLPDRRGGETRDLAYRGQAAQLTVGRYDDGRAAEVFVSFVGQFSTSDAAAAARDAAVLVSIALQHGVPVEVMRAAVTRLDGGEPASITGWLLDALCEEK